MQLLYGSLSSFGHLFQSSPVPEDGCNSFMPSPPFTVRSFQSSPVPEDGCNYLRVCGHSIQRDRFQSSPVPEDGCNHIRSCLFGRTHSFNPHPSRRTGATIKSPDSGSFSSCFNPHPSRRTGATRYAIGSWAYDESFQSSPVPEDGCNYGDATAPQSWDGFNPHPSRRTGATSYEPFEEVASWFQSSPVPEDGCNEGGAL